MKKFAAIAAALIAFSAKAEAQVSISFDEFTGPCYFVQTSPLTNAYASQGVTFSGNGSVLDQCGNWPTGNAHSGRQFLGYNSAAAPVTGAAQFASAQTNFSVWVGATSSYNFDLYLGSNLVTTLTNSTPLNAGAWTQVTSNMTFDRVTFGSGTSLLQLDDFSTSAAIVTPEPATLVLTAAGLFAVGVGARRRRKS